MKATSLLLPALALGLAGAWLGSQYLSNSSLDSQITALEKTIAASDSANKADTQPAKLITTKQAKQTKEPFDWKEIAAQIAEMEGPNETIASLRRIMKLEQRLQAMSKEELVAALEEISTLGLSNEAINTLDRALIGPLGQKDLPLALSIFIDRIHDDDNTMNWKLTNLMQAWAQIDLASAISWFDQQIAAGKFDSKTLDGESRTRILFEGSVIGPLISLPFPRLLPRLRQPQGGRYPHQIPHGAPG